MLHRLKYLFLTAIFFGLMTSCGSGNQSAEEQANNETEAVVTEENADDPLTEDATSSQDRVLLAAMSIRMQDQLSRMAQNKAESDAIKHLGQIIIASNEEALSILSNLAEATETQVPASLSTAQQQVVDSLDQLSGSEFETAFLQTLMEDQRQNIDNLESLTSETDNPITRDISQELLDIQEPQLERVQEIQDEMM